MKIAYDFGFLLLILSRGKNMQHRNVCLINWLQWQHFACPKERWIYWMLFTLKSNALNHVPSTWANKLVYWEYGDFMRKCRDEHHMNWHTSLIWDELRKSAIRFYHSAFQYASIKYTNDRPVTAHCLDWFMLIRWHCFHHTYTICRLIWAMMYIGMMKTTKYTQPIPGDWIEKIQLAIKEMFIWW